MSAYQSNRRNETAQRNPASLRFGRRATDRLNPYPASFVTQVLAEYREITAPRLVRPPRNIAVEAYRAGSTISVRRAPAGTSLSRDI